MTNRPDTAADFLPASDQPSERHGEIDETRFRAAPEEVRSGTEAALGAAFPARDD
jgi:hypothetical protein